MFSSLIALCPSKTENKSCFQNLFLKIEVIEKQAQTKVKYGDTVVDVELDSRDKMVKGTFEIPEGVSDASFSLKNNSGVDLGTFSNLLSGGDGTYHIYNGEDEIFSEDELGQEEAGTLPSIRETQEAWCLKQNY